MRSTTLAREVGKEPKAGRRDYLAPALVILGIEIASVQLLPDFRNALGQEVVGDLTLHRLRQQARGG